MSNLKDNVEILSNIIAIVTFSILCYQVWFANKQNKQKYEMARRVNATNILHQWSVNLTKEESIAKRIVEQFSEEKARALFNESDTIQVTKEQYSKLRVIFNRNNKDTNLLNNKNFNCNKHKKERQKSKKYRCHDCVNKNLHTLKKEEIILLRWYITHYLNNLETVLLFCKNGCADIDAFEEQFRYQYNTRDGVMALSKYRDAAGGIDSYPAITWFCERLEAKNKEKILQKEYVDKNISLWNDIVDCFINILNKVKFGKH